MNKTPYIHLYAGDASGSHISDHADDRPRPWVWIWFDNHNYIEVENPEAAKRLKELFARAETALRANQKETEA